MDSDNEFTFIDRESISDFINSIGQPVEIYTPANTIDVTGRVRTITTEPVAKERALIRSRGEHKILNADGLQYAGTAQAWFTFDSVIDNECEVYVRVQNGIVVFYATEKTPSLFEGEVKMILVNLEKRRYEPYPTGAPKVP